MEWRKKARFLCARLCTKCFTRLPHWILTTNLPDTCIDVYAHTYHIYRESVRVEFKLAQSDSKFQQWRLNSQFPARSCDAWKQCLAWLSHSTSVYSDLKSREWSTFPPEVGDHLQPSRKQQSRLDRWARRDPLKCIAHKNHLRPS